MAIENQPQRFRHARTILTATFLTLVASCNKTYESVPIAFYGKWKADQIGSAVAASIRPGQITLVYEDGSTEICRVTHVLVSYPLFGDGKETHVSCARPSSASLRSSQKFCGGTSPPIVYRWVVQLRQEDADDYGSIDIYEDKMSDCEVLDGESILGTFFKNAK